MTVRAASCQRWDGRPAMFACLVIGTEMTA